MRSQKLTPGSVVFLIFCFLFLVGWGREAEAQESMTAAGSDTASFRVNTDLVRLSVNVTDRLGRPVADLDRDDIRLFEDKVEQKVDYFIPDKTPLAVGLLLDSSSSMGHDYKMDRARAATLHFVLTSLPDDQVFLIDFGSRASLKIDFTSDHEVLRRTLEAVKSNGKTALYDAVYLGLDKLSRYRTERRKVILLITDGADTASRYTLEEVRDLARESDVQIYSVGILGRDMTQSSVYTLRELGELSGGQAFFPRAPGEMVNICFGIAVELHRQYILGYQSTNPTRDGKWRKLSLKINRRQGWPRLVARSRSGYYAPGVR
ncbi:MAG: VWA domain-containing protein [Acidobacteriota bacterium]